MKKICVFMCIVLLLNTFTYSAVDSITYSEIESNLPDMGVRANFDQSVVYAGENDNSVVIKILLNRASEEKVSFDFTTLNGSALAGQNYAFSSEDVVFLPGEIEKSITVQLHGESNIGLDGESLFYLSFGNIKNGLFDGDVTEKKIKVVIMHGKAVDVTTLKKLQSKNVAKGSSVDVSISYASVAYSNKSEVVLVAEFTNKVINTGALTMSVNGTILEPIEIEGTVSQRLTFVYPLKDSDFIMSRSDIELNIESIKNVGILDSQKIFELVNIKTATLGLQMKTDVQSYLHDLKLIVTMDNERNQLGHLTLEVNNFKPILEDLMKKVFNRNDDPQYQDKIFFQVVGLNDHIESIDTFYQDTNSYQLFGDFKLPVNKTGISQKYLVRVVSEDMVLPNLYAYFVVEPVVMIDDPSDMQIIYTDWPPNNKTKIKEGIYRQLDYTVRQDASWKASDDFTWTSSSPDVASIDSNGHIEIKKDGMVFFTLTALNDGLSESQYSLNTPILTIRELEQPYITIVDNNTNLKSNVSEDLTIHIGSNLTEHNYDAGFGDETEFTVSLYQVVHLSKNNETLSLIYQDKIISGIDQPLASISVDGDWLNQIAPYGVSNYAVKVEAEQIEKRKWFSNMAYIEVLSPSATVSFEKLETQYFDDEKGVIGLPWVMADLDTSNNLIESQFEVKLFATSDVYFKETGFSAASGLALFEPREVPNGVIRDEYQVTLKVRNNSGEPWAEDTQTIYVYNHDALLPTIDGLPSAHLYMSNVETIRQMDVKQILELQRDIKLRVDLSTNVINYAMFGPDNNFTWTMDHLDVVSIRDQNLIDWISFGSEYNSEEHFYLFGDADGISSIEAKHIYSGLTGNLTVEVDNLRNQLYLFDNVQRFPFTMRYTNGDGKTVQTSSDQVFSGETAIYEEHGIASDVVISYIKGEELYRAVIKHEDLLSGEGSGAIKSVYPVNTFEMATINDTILSILGDNGKPYTGTIQLLGGVYVEGVYQEDMLINGLGRYEKQSISVRDGSIKVKIDPVRLEAINYTDNVEVKLQIRDEQQSYYPIFDFYGGTEVQTFSKQTHSLRFQPYLLNRNDHSIFDEYQIINQYYQYPNGIKGSITSNLDYIYVDQLNQAVKVYSQILIPKITYDKSVSIDAYVIDKAGRKVGLDIESLNLFEGDYPFSDLQIFDFIYTYSETSLANMKLGSGEHYPVHINVKIAVNKELNTDIEVSHVLGYQLLNLNGVVNVNQTYATFATDYYQELRGYVDFSSYVDNLGVNGYVKDMIRTIALGNAAPASNRVAFIIEPGDGLLQYKAVLAFVLDDKTEILRGYGIGTYFFDLLSTDNSRPTTSVDSLIGTLDRIIENYKPMNNTLKEGDPNFKVEGYGYVTYDVRYDVNSRSWKSALINYNTTLSGAMKKQFTQHYFNRSYDLIVAEPTLAVTGTTTLSALINYRGSLMEHIDPLYDYAILYSPSIAGTISYTAESKYEMDNVNAGLSGGVTGTATVGYTHRFYESDDPVINNKNSGELKVVGTINAFFKAWAPAIGTYNTSWEIYKLTFGPYHFPNSSAWNSQYDNYKAATKSTLSSNQMLMASFVDNTLMDENLTGTQLLSANLSETLDQVGEIDNYEVSIMADGTVGIAYVLNEDQDVRLIVINPNGEIIHNEKITNNVTFKKSVKITAVTENGSDRFIVGYVFKDSLGTQRMNLHQFDSEGAELIECFQQVKGFEGESFVFSENSNELNTLYIIWNVVETGYLEDKITLSTNDVMYASRFVFDKGWYLSYPLTVAKLKTDSYFSTYTGVSLGDSLQVSYEAKTATVNSNYMESGEKTVKLVDAFEVKSVNFNTNEIYENHDVPFEFNLLNKGYRSIDAVDIFIDDKNYHFDLEVPVNPGEIASILIYHPFEDVPQQLNYTVSADFKGDKTVILGHAVMEGFDIEIGTVEQLKSFDKERSFNIKLKSSSKNRFVEGEQTVILGIYTDMFDLSNAVKEVVIKDQSSLDAILSGNYATTMTLNEELLPYLSPDGEIPTNQISFYVIASLLQEEKSLQIMDRKILKVKSLLEKSNGEIFTYDSAIRYGNSSIIDLKLYNHSRNRFMGEIIVQLFDKDNHLVGSLPLTAGNVLIDVTGESENLFTVKTNLSFKTIKLTWIKKD